MRSPLKSARRGLRLLVNLDACFRYAGGAWPFLTLAARQLAAGAWRELVAWMTAAIAYARRDDAASYRRWLKRRTPPVAGDAKLLAVLSTESLAGSALADYLGLVRAARLPHLLVVAQSAIAAMVRQQLPNADVVAVEESTIDAVLAATVEHVAQHEREEPRFELISFFAPGCVPGERPFRASERKLLIYGDEDRIDGQGSRSRPAFKPAFSPDLLLHQDYLSACATLTRSLFQDLPRQPAADLHSFALMLVEAAEEVRHVDAFVAHRLAAAEQPARMPAHLPRFLQRRYGEGAGARANADGGWTCRFGGAKEKSVSVVIPSRDRLHLLQPCVEGIYATNPEADFEVVVVDNGTTEPAACAWLAEAPQRLANLRVVAAPGAFNWCQLNNVGMARAQGEVLVFLNNDTEPRCRGWLARLKDVAGRADVGFVGALLLYPGGAIQHAGVVAGFGGCADHLYKGTDPDHRHCPFVPPSLPRNVAAVTGACMAASREALDRIGPFDENYRVSGGDVEICLRALNAGLLNVYLPDVRLVHHESQSRRGRDPQADVERLRALVARDLPSDPYYHSSLSLSSLYPTYPA